MAESPAIPSLVRGPRVKNSFSMEQTSRDFGITALGTALSELRLASKPLDEFQVLTNSYSARFGGSGSVMNATTRSGTNDFHGSVYDFLRNNVFDARDYFNTTASPQNPFRQNQFGGALGGPIKKDKLFFFVNYEGIRQIARRDFSSHRFPMRRLG